MKHLWVTACGVVWLAAQGLAQSPVLSRAAPMAVQPGAVSELTFFGEKLAGVSSLWTSFPCQPTRIKEPASAGQVTFRLAVPSGTRPGLGAVRLAGTNGISNLLLMSVDDLPSVAESGTNKNLASAQTIQPPVAVDGVIDEMGFDFYKVTARKGQRFVVEVVAQRMNSRLDPVVRLLDAKGRELAYSDDEPGLGADARFAWTCPATGVHELELRDILYDGGARHRYRLRVGDLPLPPPALPAPTRGWSEVAETEPNDSAPSATHFTAPTVLSGRLGRNGDRDFYQFEAAKNQRIVFRAHMRSLGSPGEVFMQLQRADGSKVAEARVTGADESTLTNKFGEAGTYRLLVEELNRRGGSNFVYRVEVEPLRAGFALSVETEKLEATAGGKFEIKVACARHDHDGPVELSLDEAGEGFALENAVLPEKKNEAVLKVAVPSSLTPGALIHFRIVGRARIGEAEQRVTASTRPALRKLFPQVPYPPAELDGLISLGIRAADGSGAP